MEKEIVCQDPLLLHFIPSQLWSDSPVFWAPELCFLQARCTWDSQSQCWINWLIAPCYLRHLAKNFTYTESFNSYIFFCSCAHIILRWLTGNNHCNKGNRAPGMTLVWARGSHSSPPENTHQLTAKQKRINRSGKFHLGPHSSRLNHIVSWDHSHMTGKELAEVWAGRDQAEGAESLERSLEQPRGWMQNDQLMLTVV